MRDPRPFYSVLKGRKFLFRPIQPSDKEFLIEGYKELSPRSKYLRFFAIHNELSPEQLVFFTEVDGINHVAWGILDVTGENSVPAGIGRFVRDKADTKIAEVAITIVDKYQQIGLGRILLVLLNLLGGNMGFEIFRYHVLVDNIGILKSLLPLKSSRKKIDESLLLIDTKVVTNHTELQETPSSVNFIQCMKWVEAEMLGID